MRIVILQGEAIHTAAQLHSLLEEKLGLPSYYGRNLDALWDVLTGWVDMPLTLEWRNYEASVVQGGDEIERVAGLLDEVENENIGFRFVRGVSATHKSADSD